uniref:Uncharacterized protein n=1 Tax=Dromaius novaehollandiae TaxID=8790 RepID=A0A8C4K0N7_DRONO
SLHKRRIDRNRERCTPEPKAVLSAVDSQKQNHNVLERSPSAPVFSHTHRCVYMIYKHTALIAKLCQIHAWLQEEVLPLWYNFQGERRFLPVRGQKSTNSSGHPCGYMCILLIFTPICCHKK